MTDTMTTTQKERGRVLLPIARASIAGALGRHVDADETDDWLKMPGASFVTLKWHDRLRGCIGSLEAHRTLLTDVKANAQAAAFRDTRFAPLALAELEDTRIEVSVLSPKQPIVFASEAEAHEALRPGVDGVILEYGHYRSTFLPQVWEQLPTPDQFLRQLKQKAGLVPHFWTEGMRLYRYGVDKWAE